MGPDDAICQEQCLHPPRQLQVGESVFACRNGDGPLPNSLLDGATVPCSRCDSDNGRYCHLSFNPQIVTGKSAYMMRKLLARSQDSENDSQNSFPTNSSADMVLCLRCFRRAQLSRIAYVSRR